VQLETQQRGTKPMLSAPVMRALWDLTRDGYAPEFAGYVDALLEGLPIVGSPDFKARLNVVAAKLKTPEITPKSA
jgi:hypothetical protein